MKIAYINIFVSDLDRAINFYQNILGLTLNMSEENFGYASFNAGPISLGLAVPEFDQRHLIGGHTGIGLAVSDLNKEYQALRKQEVKFSMPPTKQPWGGFMALLEDPDSNSFYLDQIE